MTDHPAPTPRPAPPAHTAAGVPGPEDIAADRSLEAALARLDVLDGLGVHEHVDVYDDVDRALRERLAGAEG
ncbi:hypothetical protein MO973_34510 [Paenibacillus sp. TRM 82003]|uniref:hypothetical protein n=1 Tax=Kineococcus sp. TRM81007 TaxID=2925831 RepID=UPI001F579093|nr:hypothetical protein [Kineococcus sp. TRM81007]MCI2240739.1 hypothetical protein [Kineococcus sp. TRM81007]MCI3925337.1 hypothetical protein [Paenibacillus sp. TRM 82003]